MVIKCVHNFLFVNVCVHILYNTYVYMLLNDSTGAWNSHVNCKGMGVIIRHQAMCYLHTPYALHRGN